MLNGVKDFNEWKNIMTQEQREYKIFEVLCNVDSRLKKVESRAFFNKTTAFFGGIIGGIIGSLSILIKS